LKDLRGTDPALAADPVAEHVAALLAAVLALDPAARDRMVDVLLSISADATGSSAGYRDVAGAAGSLLYVVGLHPALGHRLVTRYCRRSEV
jgi:hypothetical protein